ncbi:hypothetical protein [Enterococcus sp. LJL90]
MKKKNKKTTKRKKWLILALLLLLVSIVGGGLYWYFSSKTEEKTATVVAGSFLPEGKDAAAMTDDEIATYAQAEVDASQFQMIIGSEIQVDSQDDSSNLYIQNPPTNAYPIAVTITLDDGTVVYSSGAIAVGYEVKNATLDTHLDTGTYTGTALFKLYDAETSEAKGQVAATVSFTVT